MNSIGSADRLGQTDWLLPKRPTPSERSCCICAERVGVNLIGSVARFGEFDWLLPERPILSERSCNMYLHGMDWAHFFASRLTDLVTFDTLDYWSIQ